MELILIGENKLKIMLSPDDMQKYEINCDSVDYANTETRRAFWNILDEAKHKTGFDAASDRVYIQLYPSKSGGCEMYVTKIGMICTPQKQDTYTKPTAKESFISCTLDNMDSLLRACSTAKKRQINCQSRAYAKDDGTYMLFVFAEQRLFDRLGFLGEFGYLSDDILTSAYADEHCKCICRERAIETLAALL